MAVSCGDNGSINFWDYESGYCFQKSTTIAQPGRIRDATAVDKSTIIDYLLLSYQAPWMLSVGYMLQALIYRAG